MNGGTTEKTQKGMDEMMMMRQMETTVTEVGTASTSLQEREGVRERERERQRQRVRVETGKCETEFKERTVKALFFKLENLIRFL